MFEIKNSKLKLIIGGGNQVDLHPFFTIFEHGTYLYDSFISKNNIIDMIEYPRGKREMFLTLNFGKIIEKIPTESKHLISDKIYAKEEKIISEKVLNIEDFVEPKFLTDWVENAIYSDDKISLLQMGKGMGKSTFIRALDPFAIDKIEIEDTFIRTYYINSTYGSKLYEFRNDVNRIFSRKNNGDEWDGDIAVLVTNTETPSEDFAAFLNKVKRLMYPTDNLVFILDGLDELTKQPGLNIIDFIPTDGSLLDEGIQIIITSRINNLEDKLYSYNIKCLDYLKEIPRLQVYTEDLEYINLKREYLDTFIFDKYKETLEKKKIKFNISEEDKKPVYELAKKENMLFLRQYFELVSIRINNEMINGAVEINSNVLDINDEVLKEYFSTIEKRYGEKYYNKFIQIIMVFIIADDELTIEELSYLVENGNTSFAFLGFLNSIRMFLTASRTARGNTLKLSHIENIKFIKTYLVKNYVLTIKDLYSKIEDFAVSSKMDYEDIQSILVLSYFYQIIKSSKELELDIYDKAKKLFIKQFVEFPVFMNWNLTDSQIDWNLKLFKGFASFYEEELTGISYEYDAAYFRTLCMLGFFSNLRTYSQDTKNYIQKGFKLADSLALTDQDKYYRYRYFPSILLFAYQQLNEVEKGKEMILTAYEKVKELKNSGYSIRNQDIGFNLSFIGFLYFNSKEYKKSYDYYLKAIECFKGGVENIDIWNQGIMYDYAGEAATQIGLFEEAEKQLFKALDLYNDLKKNNYMKSYIDIYKSYEHLAQLYIELTNYEEALVWTKKNLLFLEETNDKRLLSNKTNVLFVLIEKTKLELKLGLIEDAKGSISKANEFYSQLNDIEKNKTLTVEALKCINDLG